MMNTVALTNKRSPAYRCRLTSDTRRCRCLMANPSCLDGSYLLSRNSQPLNCGLYLKGLFTLREHQMRLPGTGTIRLPASIEISLSLGVNEATWKTGPNRNCLVTTSLDSAKRTEAPRSLRVAIVRSRAAGNWAGEGSPISTIRTGAARFCTSSAPCEEACEGLRLDSGTRIGPNPRVCPDFGAKRSVRPRARQGRLQLSTGKWRCLESRCAKYQQNTICCGLLLTRTMDSGIFSSAAVNGL
jgi:hypothetical protein